MDSEFNLEEYLSNGVENIVKGALKASLKNPKESLYITKFGLACREAATIRANHEIKGIHIPSFLIASITNDCNLHCAGCYSRANNSCKEQVCKEILGTSDWKRIFHEAVEMGVSFILIAGGEPFMRPEVIEAAAEYKKIMFPIFTNGTLFNNSYYNLFDKNRNLLPILSVEGEEEYTDTRRGTGIYSKLLLTMQKMMDQGIFYGASITVTKDNLHNITDNTFLSELYHRGCKLIFFVEYVPVDRKSMNIVLTEQQRIELDSKLGRLRLQYPDMIILSFPGDEKSAGGCLAAGRGFFHINASGSAEPCPFSPYSDINLRNCSLIEALQSPLFVKLAESNILNREHNGGCVLFEQEEEVKKICNIK